MAAFTLTKRPAGGWKWVVHLLLILSILAGLAYHAYDKRRFLKLREAALAPL